MHRPLILFIALLLWGCTKPEALSVYVFLSTECPLSREQTYALREAHRQYGQQVQFFAVFPNQSDTPEAVAQFAQKYKLSFSLLNDPDHQWVDSMRASVTPEVFLLDKGGEVLYSGQIDNRMLRLGQKRKVVTEHYLAQAIAESLAGKPLSIRETQPVGCSIFHSM